MAVSLIHVFRKVNVNRLEYIHRKCYATSKSELVTVLKQKKLHIIGLNRPEKRNCVNSETAEQLMKAFDDFETDDNAYAAVLYGIGGNFCSGYDLSEVAKGDFEHIASRTAFIGPSHTFCKKPIVAAVSGYAVAGGFELALWCDLRVVEETAIMGFFSRRFGVPLIDGGTVRLPQLIGLSRALDLILTGRGINAKEALEMGIANKIVPCGAGLGNAVNFATSLCKFPQQCLRADRNSTYHSVIESNSLKSALTFEHENSKHCLNEESIKGAESFMKGIGRHGSFHLDAKLPDDDSDI